MDSVTSPPPGQTATYPLGVREPLPVVDLPEPEEVFGVPHLGRKEVVKFVLGPSLIALGISIGSGEWLLGPLNVGTLGFVGVGWIITISALLQVFYNIEFSRYVLATGEVPIVGFGRVPPGAWLWIPFSLIALFFAFIWGGWAKSAAQGLFALITGRIPGDGDTITVTLLAILLLLVVLGITVVSRKITRGLEFANLASIGIQLVFLLIVDLFIVPFSVWWDALRGLVTPALPPEGSDATLLGGLAGFTALASGLNWYVMNHYRDKGYGMGARVGYLAGLRGERREVRAVGVTFPRREERRPVEAVAPVRIRSGLPSTTSPTRPLACTNEGQWPCRVSDDARPGPAVGGYLCPIGDGGLTAVRTSISAAGTRPYEAKLCALVARAQQPRAPPEKGCSLRRLSLRRTPPCKSEEAHRCAQRRLCRSLRTVRGEVGRSDPAPLGTGKSGLTQTVQPATAPSS
jgi:hypothetical protein